MKKADGIEFDFEPTTPKPPRVRQEPVIQKVEPVESSQPVEVIPAPVTETTNVTSPVVIESAPT
jgi:hypothetical protein